MSLHLETWDWIIMAVFMLLFIGVGLSKTQAAGKNLQSYFLGGRKLPWVVAGISMVATTFAADTPLLVSEVVARDGISGNWIWWNFLLGGMLTTFFFARLWQRSGVLTEVELIGIRYGGKPAFYLRLFKSVYLGLFLNVIIIGWVNFAMISLLQGMFGISYGEAFLYTALAMFAVGIYVSLSGLLGVAYADVIQFILAMTGCIILAILVVNSPEIGGIQGMKEKLIDFPGALDFFPRIGDSSEGTFLAFSMGIGTFLARIGLQWWASWYPGAEPGGGGYVAQRMMSVKSQRGALKATLLFQLAHYCLRPWPWIIIGLCALVLYPDLGANEKQMGFVYVMRDYLPVGLKGLLLTAFFAAYMSTISTQLNWGASYLVNDFYLPLRSKGEENNVKRSVWVSRLATVLLMLVALGVSSMITSLQGIWDFLLSCGAGLGLVLILRWYWWRINVWSELCATIAPFIAYGIYYWLYPEMSFGESMFRIVGFTTIAWLSITFLTPPEKKSVLESFYFRVKPPGWWSPVIGLPRPVKGLGRLFAAWIAAVIMGYSILFGLGKFILMEWQSFWIWSGIGLFSCILLIRYFPENEKELI